MLNKTCLLVASYAADMWACEINDRLPKSCILL